MDKPKLEIIVIHETVAQSFVKDALGIALAAAMIGAGKFIDSTAAQWVGFLLFCLSMIAAANRANKQNRMTPQDAADHIRARWGVVAGSDKEPAP